MRFTVVAVFAVVLTLGVSATSLGAKPNGKPDASDCMLDGFTFVYGADAESAGIVRCASAKAWIRVSAVVTRDGAFVASGEHRCRKTSDCQKTFAPLEDPSGDQQWCVEVRAVLQGASIGPRTFCEQFEDL